jgi:ribosomal protein S27AE
MARNCPSCAARTSMARFEDEDGLSGWRCAACGDGAFDAENAQRYAAAGDVADRAERILLRERDTVRVLDLLENLPSPTPALLAAAKRRAARK